jgi:8-oxo-dGTP pyrophosphatase MutT (NUDIX family)
MNDKKIWKEISSKIVAQNRYITMKESMAKRPNGKVLPYYHLNMLHFSMVIPVDSDNFTYLIGQYRFAIKKYNWEFPMGHVDGENPRSTAKIELEEETGLKANRIIYLGKFYIGAAVTDQMAHAFAAYDLTQGKFHREEGEFLETKKVPLKNISSMIKNGEITDGPSITAFQLLNLKTKTG